MSEDVIVYETGSVRLGEVITLDPAGVVSTVLAYAYPLGSSTAVTGVNGAAGSVDPGTPAATSHDIWYDWVPGAGTAGEYQAHLKYTTGGNTYVTDPISVLVWPLSGSKYDPYIEGAKLRFSEHRVGEAQQVLSTWQYYKAVNQAFDAYSRKNKRRLTADVALTAGVWEYPLTGTGGLAGFVTEWSEIERLLPHYDAALQVQWAAGPLEYEVDREQGKWRLRCYTPAAGDTARVVYTGRWTITHAADSAGGSSGADFEPLCDYVAGAALEMAAVLSTHTEAPEIAAAFSVEVNTKADRYAAAAKRLKDRARGAWGRPKELRL